MGVPQPACRGLGVTEVFIFDCPREKCWSCPSPQKSTLFFKQGMAMLFLPWFSLVSVHRGLLPHFHLPASQREVSPSSLHCTWADVQQSIQIYSAGICASPAWCLRCSPEREVLHWSCLSWWLFHAERPEVTPRKVPRPKPQPRLAAKQRRFSLVYNVVRQSSWKSESEPSLLPAGEVTDTRFSTTYWHAEW